MKIAIITGASSGLGREFARLLDERGELDEIWVVARRENRLSELRDALKTPVRPLAYDLTEKASVRAIAGLLEAEKPEVMTLINAAGFGKIGSFDDIPLEDNENMIDLNCRAAVAITQTVIPFMPPGSHILEICSTSSFQPLQYLSVYSASKAFLYRYSRALRIELFPRRVSVTAVCPYWIKDTEFIGTAQRTGNSGYVRSFPVASKEITVAKWALNDADLGLPVSTPGIICFAHRVFAKFIPHEIMLGIWGLLRKM